MNPTVPKAELLERERRWILPAGIASLVGVALFVGAFVIQQSTGANQADTDAERLTNIHDNSGALLFGDVIASLGVLLFSIPLLFLFLAAAGRSDRVQRLFIALAVLGPLLLAVQGVLRAVSLQDVADQFVAQEPSVERQADGDAADGGGTATDATTTGTTAGEATGTDATGTATSATNTTGTDTTGTDTTGNEGDGDEKTPREQLAENLIDDSGSYQTATNLLIPGIFAMIFGMVYIPLWAMRTGLLTRFWATLGMALGVTLALLPFAQLGLMIWFAAVGLLLVGAWPGGRPPAWAAGEAIPWPKPGQPPPPPPGDGDTVEGSGRELSEPPLPEPGQLEEGFEVPDYPPEPDESQGRRRKKRKRRR